MVKNHGARDPLTERSWLPRPMLAPLAFLLVGVGYTLTALGLPMTTALGPGPGFVPLLIGLLIVGTSIWALVSGATAVPLGEPFPVGDAAWRVSALLALVIGYTILLVPLGHLLSATVMASLALWVLGRRPWWATIGLGLALSVGSWTLFDQVLGLPLPAGPLR